MQEISAAEFVISAIGGITSTARAIRRPPTTVQGWKDRGTIPQKHWDALIAAASERGRQLEVSDFRKAHPKPSEAA